MTRRGLRCWVGFTGCARRAFERRWATGDAQWRFWGGRDMFVFSWRLLDKLLPISCVETDDPARKLWRDAISANGHGWQSSWAISCWAGLARRPAQGARSHGLNARYCAFLRGQSEVFGR